MKLIRIILYILIAACIIIFIKVYQDVKKQHRNCGVSELNQRYWMAGVFCAGILFLVMVACTYMED